jgi:putative polyhydroxyalkanoate system protein
MSRIYLQREHGLDRKTLRRRAEALAKQLQSEYGGNYRWEGDTVHYNYSGGIDARLTLQDNDILVDVKLGVLMLMLKGALTREIGRYLEEHLG